MHYRTINEADAEKTFEGEGGLVTMPLHGNARGIEHITKERSEEVARKLKERVPITVIAEQIDALRAKGQSIAAEVHAERLRQNQKFTGSPVGIQHHSSIGWSSILFEEAGESAQGLNDLYWTNDSVEKLQANLAHTRLELIQAMAVSQAIIERIDAMDAALISPEGKFPHEPNPEQVV